MTTKFASAALKPGQIEIVWLKDNSTQIVQTHGLAYNTGALVLDVDGSKIIVPLSSVKHFRVANVDVALTKQGTVRQR